MSAERNIISKYKDPKNFWTKIKQLKGNQNNTTPYIIHNNEEIYKEIKREIFKDIWENVVEIT